MIRFVLDTDHLSLHQRGYRPIFEKVATIPKEQIAITAITVEEMMRGRLARIRKAKNKEERVRAYFWLIETLSFLNQFQILPYNDLAEDYFDGWRSQKIRIGSQDLRIAGISLAHNATLVTRNQKDFAQIPDLSFTSWV